MAQPEKQPWVTFGKEEGQNRNLSGMTQQITEKGHNKNKNKKKCWASEQWVLLL